MRKPLFLIVFIGCMCKCFAVEKMYIFHINGINTSRAEAVQNANALEQAVKFSSNMIANKGHFDLLYNTDEGDAFCELCHQLADVTKQRALEQKNITVDDFVIAYMKTYHLNYESGSTDYEILKMGIKDDYLKDKTFVGNNMGDIYNQFKTKTSQDKFRFLMKYIANNEDPTINSKPSILLIPHSQGNLYANELTDYLYRAEGYPYDHISVVGIASPSSLISGAFSQYVTADNDLIVKGVSVLSQLPPHSIPPVEPNAHNESCLLCHELIGSYLSTGDTHTQIKNKINDSIAFLKDILIRDGLKNNQISFAFRMQVPEYPRPGESRTPESYSAAIYYKESIVYNMVSDTAHKDGFYYLNLPNQDDSNRFGNVLIADITKYPLGKYQIRSLDNKNKWIDGYMEGARIKVYAKNGYYLAYSPYCYDGFESVSCMSLKQEGKFYKDVFEDAQSNDFKLKIDSYIESNDVSKYIPEIYQDGKIIFGEFTVN